MKRDFLKCGQTIRVYLEPGGTGSEVYQIISVIGEGGCSVCYQAIRMHDGKVGKLKEFYPAVLAGEDGLRRMPDGQLSADPAITADFSKMCDAYVHTYHRLDQIMESNPKNEVLKLYIQNGDIRYGRTENGTRSSAYVWSTGFAGWGLDCYLEKVREEPQVQSDLRLDVILQTLITITECTSVLHLVGMLNLDIKPGNFFLPYNSEYEFTGNNVSLFDISTLYHPADEEPMSFAGTVGFAAPELSWGGAYEQSDLYSIGAMLFYALVSPKQVPDGSYTRACYRDINHLVRNSVLIRSSHSADDALLLDLLASILRRTLKFDYKKRYARCEELLTDLKRAQARTAQFGRISQALAQRERFGIQQIKEKSVSSYKILIQKMLHDHPLFEALGTDERELPVLLLGSGSFGQTFLDQVLEIGQMNGYRLHLVAMSDASVEDRRRYLQFRHDLTRFVSVNGSEIRENHEAYTALDFCPLTNDTRISKFDDNREHNKNLLSGIFESARKQNRAYRYLFIALGDDGLNRKIAALAAEVSKDSSLPICYIQEHRRDQTEELPPNLHAIYTDEPITADLIDPNLEQMAFNTHLIWQNCMNVDLRKTWDEYLASPGYHASSLAFALSIQYKLYSIGIVLEGSCLAGRTAAAGWTVVKNAEEAARAFSEQILEPMETYETARHKFEILVMMEHRRWIMDRVTAGIRFPTDETGAMSLAECVERGKANVEDRFMHACLVDSRSEAPLGTAAYRENNCAKWVEPVENSELDPLDEISVRLYQRLRRRADEIRNENPMRIEAIQAVEEKICSCGEAAVLAWKQYVFCLKNIVAGMESYARQTPFYEGLLRDSLQDAPEQPAKEIRSRLAQIQSAFRYLRAAALHTDYKAYDQDMMKKIPFIMTYRCAPRLAVSFGPSAFANVAAAVILMPRRLVYVYTYDERTVKQVQQSLSSALNFLRDRKAHTEVSFAAAYPQSISEEALTDLQEQLSRIDEPLLKECCLLPYGADPHPVLVPFLKERKIDLYDRTEDDGGWLREAGIPSFQLERNEKKFSNLDGCEYLRYIRDNSYLGVQDLFSMQRVETVRWSIPDFAEEHQNLWRIYQGAGQKYLSYQKSVENWEKLCGILAAQEQPALASFPLSETGGEKDRELRFILPDYVVPAVRSLLKELISAGIAGADSALVFHTYDSCKVSIRVSHKLVEPITRAFSRPERLLSFYQPHLERTDSALELRCASMSVTEADLSSVDDPEQSEQLYDILCRLQKLQCIRSLQRNPYHINRVSFDYTSASAKKLLTEPEDLLRTCAYYQIVKTGCCHEVVSGCEFRWPDGETEELDLMVTRGFRSVLIHCRRPDEAAEQAGSRLMKLANRLDAGSTLLLLDSRLEKKTEYFGPVLAVSPDEIGETVKELLK